MHGGPSDSTSSRDGDSRSTLPLSHKGKNGVSPVVLAGATTATPEVVTTTTHTTTHFFSLPIWRKRAPPVLPSSHQSMPGSDMDEFGSVSRPSHLLVEKELPPTPVGDSNSTTFGTSDERATPPLNASTPPVQQHIPILPVPRSSMSSPSPLSQPTLALAHAALGIGLPHVMPRASSSNSDVNTVAFLPPPSSRSRISNSGIRRAKSSQRLNRTSPQTDTVDEEAAAAISRRRTRGLSLGPGVFLQFSAENKGKEKELDPTQTNRVPANSLARKPSFWSRRKAEAQPLPSVGRTPDILYPPLPSMPPVSPFDMTLETSQDTSSSNYPPSVLLRSHSDRVPSSSNVSIGQQSVSGYPQSSLHSQSERMSRKSQRPATADASLCEYSSATPSHSQPPPAAPHDPSPHKPKHSSRLPSRPSTSSGNRRPRAQTNPPLLHRLSINLFSSSTPSTNLFGNHTTTSPAESAITSPRSSFSKAPAEIPEPLVDEESPDDYLRRLLASISKAEVASALASSGDSFHVRALRAYIDQFDFSDNPLDVALRKLLMDVGLPRETQQIDRVIEAFAGRYLQCNTGLFISEDHPYILAFSLIMLHTDAFNRSNKRKMTKSDYVKNTKLPGVSAEVLDCFYDNIVFAPFIFIEDPLDVNGQRGIVSDGTFKRFPAINGQVSGTSNAGSLLGKTNKIDPYYLITRNLLGPLRVNVELYVPKENPYIYEGTAGPWNEEEVRLSFAQATLIEVGAVDHRMSSPFLGVSATGVPGPMLGSMGAFPEILPSTGEVRTLRVAKVGLVNLKDEILEGGKKPKNRKWKIWSLILTGSQLLLFRDSDWALSLMSQSESSGHSFVLPQTPVFRPDELLSVKEAIAVFDTSYTKHSHTFRLALLNGRHILLQPPDETQMNEWISRINYASAFKTAGIGVRALGMSGRDLKLTGVAAATSHLHDLQGQRQPPPKSRSWDGEAPNDLMDMLSGPKSPRERNPGRTPLNRRLTIMTGREDMDLEVPIAPEVEGAVQFKITFDHVKAELAAGHYSSSEESLLNSDEGSHPRDSCISLSDASDGSPPPLRFQVVQVKVRDLDSKIDATQSQLDADLRFIRNIATLTPFQRATRDRLQTVVEGAAKRIMRCRLDMAMFLCHRSVLAEDLIAEEKDMRKAKKTALKAATETLQIRNDNTISRMTVSTPSSGSEAQPALSPSTQSDSPSFHPESSICESFHSALDFGPHWLSTSDEILNPDFLSPARLSDSPVTATPISDGAADSSTSSFPFADLSPSSTRSGEPSSVLLASRVRTSSETVPMEEEIVTHERFYTAAEISEEQAEEWHMTRCAKRVSLVRMPSDLSNVLGRRPRYTHGRTEGILDEDSASP